jgi:Peptide methionine sulfoxide reductase
MMILKHHLEKLLDIFFKTHDPTTLNRQGNDVGTQYRSVIFYENKNELIFFEDYINKLNESNSFNSKIVTTLEKKSHFYFAEEYHHNYFEKNPLNGYCNMVVRPKVEKFRTENN